MSVRKKIREQGSDGRKSRWWIADYTDGGGRRHQQRFKRKDDAKAHEEKSKVAIRAGTHVALDSDAHHRRRRHRLDQARRSQRHAARRPGRAHHVRQYRQHVNLHIVPRIGTLKLAKLNVRTIEKFRDALLDEKDENGKPTHVAGDGAQGADVSLKSCSRSPARARRRRRDDRHRRARQAPAGDRPRHPDARRDQAPDRGREG